MQTSWSVSTSHRSAVFEAVVASAVSVTNCDWWLQPDELGITPDRSVGDIRARLRGVDYATVTVVETDVLMRVVHEVAHDGLRFGNHRALARLDDGVPGERHAELVVDVTNEGVTAEAGARGVASENIGHHSHELKRVLHDRGTASLQIGGVDGHAGALGERGRWHRSTAKDSTRGLCSRSVKDR